MSNLANNLFLLGAELSQLKNKDQVIKLFIERIKSIFSNGSYEWLTEKEINNQLLDICTSSKSYGFIQISGEVDFKSDDYAMLQNAVQMLAIILEKIEQEKSFIEEKNRLQKLIDEQTKELINSSSEIKSITENSPDIILRFNREGKHLFANSKVFDVTGIKAEEFVGKTHRELGFPEEMCIYWEKNIDQVFQSGKIFETDFDFLSNNKKTIFNWRLIPEFNSDGKVVTVLSISRDITERRMTEEALLESNELFLQFMHHSPFYTFIKEVTPTRSQVIQASDNFHEMIGISSDQMIGKNMYELFPEEFAAKMTADDWNVVSNGEILKLDESFNGRNYSTIKFPIVQRGKTFLAGYTIDITERKEAEEALRISEARFRSILQDVETVAVQGYSSDGTTQYWNQASERLYGYSAQEAIGQNLLELIIPPEMKEDVQKAIEQMAKTGEPIPASELLLMHKDGSRVPVFSSHAIVHIPGHDQELFCIDIDLREQKHAEDSLHKTEQSYQEIFNSTTEAIFIDDASTGKMIDVNDTMLRIYGYTSKEEVLSINIGDLSANITPYTEDVAQNYIYKAINEGPQTFEWLAKKKDGTIFWIEMILKKTDIGGEGRIIAVGRDISERKSVEEALKKSEDKFSKAFNLSPDAITIAFAENGRYFEINDAFLRKTGFSRDEVIGHSSTELNVWVNAGDRQRYISELTTSGNLRNFEIQYRMKNGEIRDFMVSSEMFELDQKQMSLNFIVDITERKKAEETLKKNEERLRLSLEATTDAVWEWDLKTNETYFSPRWYEIFGYSPDQIKMNSKEWVALAHPDDREAALKTIYQSMADGSSYEVEFRSKHADGHWVWCLVKGKVTLHDSDGKPIRISGTNSDITLRKKYEQELVDSKIELLVKNQEYQSLNEEYTVINEELSETNITLLKTINELKIAKQHTEESEERYKRITSGLTDYLYTVFIKDGKVIKTIHSEACLAVTGYSSAEFATDPYLWINMVVPEEREWVAGRFLQILEGKDLPSFEHRIICKDGSIRWVNDTAILKYDTDGNLVSYDGVIKDITGRKQTEETLNRERNQLRTLIDNLPESVCIYIKDTESRYVINNLAHLKSMGVTKQEDALGKTSFDFFPADQAEKFLTDEKEVILTGKELIEKEEIVFDKSLGESRWHLTTKVPLRDSSGEIIGLVGMSNDITERKKVEEALKESEEKYRGIFENIQDVFYEASIEGIILDLSPSIEALSYGQYQRSDLIGKSMYSFYADPTERENLIKKLSKEGGVSDFEITLKNKNGALIQCSLSSKLTLDKTGNPVKIIGSIRNVNERKISEKALREGEERFRKAFIVSPDSININRLSDGVYIQINSGFTRIMGYTEEDIIGKSSIELNIWKNVEDRNKLVEGLKKHGTVENLEAQFCAKDGTIKNGLMSATVIELNNEMHILSITRDVTERKLIEEAFINSKLRYEELFSKASEGIVTISPTGQILEVNQSYADMHGYSIEELLGKDIRSLDSPVSANTSSERISRILKGDSLRFEIEHRHKHGHYFPLEVSASTVFIGDEIHIQAFNRDITERRKIEQELNAYQNYLEELVKARTEELDRANESLKREIEKEKEYELMLQKSLEKEKELSEMKSKFISTTSHEFRTPLTSILSSAGMLQRYSKQWSDEKKDEHLERIQNSVDYLTKLLDDILTISRTETGKISFNPESIDLQRFAEECTHDAKLLTTNMHQLKFNYKSKRKEFYLDAKLMKFIFNNLLSNAAKYSPAGGIIELNISTDRKNLLIQLSDEGIGIPAEETGKIFESFYRTKNAENISGNGLGLAIVKRAVDLHTGEIVVKSELGKGTTFIVRIPIMKNE